MMKMWYTVSEKVEYMDQAPPVTPSTNRYLILTCIVMAALVVAALIFLSWERKRNGPERLPPVNNQNEPVWQTYKDGRISFSYPTTFCSTSWADDWDTSTCDEPWRVELANADREPMSALDAAPGMIVYIFPSYSSFGGEFGGDIEITYLAETTFNNAIASLGLPSRTTSKGYQVWIRKNVEEYPGNIDEYYLQGNSTMIRIANYFPQRYPRYLELLLSSLTFLPVDNQWSLLTWNPGVNREEVERADWHGISVTRYGGFELPAAFIEKRSADCQAGATNDAYLRTEGGMCQTGFWLENTATGQKIDSPGELWKTSAPPNEKKVASYAAATLSDLQMNAEDLFQGKIATRGKDFLLQVTHKNTFGCTSHKPLLSIYRLSVSDDESATLTRLAYEKDPGPITTCAD